MGVTKNISIEENKFIEWIEFDNNDENIFYFDKLLNPTWEFWKKLETECVIECCGIDALAFWQEDIQTASQNFDITDLISEFSNLKNEIENQDKQIVSSSKLNNLFHKKVFIQLLKHILETLKTINK